MTPIVLIAESYWRQTLVSLLRDIAATLHLNLPLGVTNEGQEAIKQFLAPSPGTQRKYKYASLGSRQFLATLSDSCIKNRGVTHYLLPLLFSLVSLLFSLYFCVLNQKYQK